MKGNIIPSSHITLGTILASRVYVAAAVDLCFFLHISQEFDQVIYKQFPVYVFRSLISYNQKDSSYLVLQI